MIGVHIFIRPVMSNVVMVDLDGFKGKLDDLLRLQPRALVQASAGHYQVWLTVGGNLPGKTALWVTEQLAAALGGDKRSKKNDQKGRLLGSRNVKPEMNQPTVLMHTSKQDMDEQVFMGMTDEVQFVV